MNDTENSKLYLRILDIAIADFGGRTKAEEWLRTPNPEIDGQSPEDLLISKEGYDEVFLLLDDEFSLS